MSEENKKAETAVKDPHRYDAFLLHIRPVSQRHAPMPLSTRAAVFAPFAALTGFDGQIQGAQYCRCSRILLTEEAESALDLVLRSLSEGDSVTVTWFHVNPGTDGAGGTAEGEYLTAAGVLQSLDPLEQRLRILEADGSVREILFSDLLDIAGPEERELPFSDA